ncbi:hypothetical protein ACFLTZ_01220 [Chloroflexota bacterium]
MGLMDYDEKQTALQAIQGRYRGCSNCGTQGGTLGGIVGLQIMEKAIPSGIAAGNQILPVIPLTCSQCGSVIFFQAKQFISVD